MTSSRWFPGPRMFHTTTALNNGSFFIFGGRTSPLKPRTFCLLLKIEKTQERSSKFSSSVSIGSVSESIKTTHTRTGEDACYCGEGFRYSCDVLDFAQEGPSPRWRHTATRITLKGNMSIIFMAQNFAQFLPFLSSTC